MKTNQQQARQDAFAHEAWQKVHKDLIARAKLGKLMFDTQMRELNKPGFEAQFKAELQKQGFDPAVYTRLNQLQILSLKRGLLPRCFYERYSLRSYRFRYLRN